MKRIILEENLKQSVSEFLKGGFVGWQAHCAIPKDDMNKIYWYKEILFDKIWYVLADFIL